MSPQTVEIQGVAALFSSRNVAENVAKRRKKPREVIKMTDAGCKGFIFDP